MENLVIAYGSCTLTAELSPDGKRSGWAYEQDNVADVEDTDWDAKIQLECVSEQTSVCL